jgi:MtN3 and saliva related transmembrane protein
MGLAGELATLVTLTKGLQRCTLALCQFNRDRSLTVSCGLATIPRGNRAMKLTELIGWASSLILLATIGRQVYTQWKTKSTQGVSHWLFVGQCAASTGFTVYSLLLGSWVFVFSNVMILVMAIVGQVTYKHNVKPSQGVKP